MKNSSIASRAKRVFKIYETIAPVFSTQVESLKIDSGDEEAGGKGEGGASFTLRTYAALNRGTFWACVVNNLRSAGFAVDEFQDELVKKTIVIDPHNEKNSVKLHCPGDASRLSELSAMPLNSGIEFFHRVVIERGELGFGDKRFVENARQQITELFLKAKAVKKRSSGIEQLKPLSLREIQVLSRWADGLSGAEISLTLNISIKTVDRHKANIRKKTGFSTHAALIKYAISKGLVSL